MSSESQVVQTVSTALEAVEKALEEIKSFDGLDDSQIAIATQSVNALEDQLVATRNLLIGPPEEEAEADEPECQEDKAEMAQATTGGKEGSEDLSDSLVEAMDITPDDPLDKGLAETSEHLTESVSLTKVPLSDPDANKSEPNVAKVAEIANAEIAAEDQVESVLSEETSDEISESEPTNEGQHIAPVELEDDAIKTETDERLQAAQALIRENNLTLIRGIDDQMAENLKSEGIHTFAQIAEFTENDIVYFSQDLKDPGRIARENWIEQAALLSKDIATHYALSLQEMVVETLEPQDNQPVQTDEDPSKTSQDAPDRHQAESEENELSPREEARLEARLETGQETRPERTFIERPRFDRRRSLSAQEHHVHVTNPDWEVKYDEISTELAEDHNQVAMPATPLQSRMDTQPPSQTVFQSGQPQLFRSASPFRPDQRSSPAPHYRSQGTYQPPSETNVETAGLTQLKRGLDEPIAPTVETYATHTNPNPQSGFPSYGGQQEMQQAGFHGQTQSYYQYEAESYPVSGAIPPNPDAVYRGDPQDQPLPEESSKEAIEAWSTYWQEVDQGTVQEQYRQETKNEGGLRATARRFANVFKRSFRG